MVLRRAVPPSVLGSGAAGVPDVEVVVPDGGGKHFGDRANAALAEQMNTVANTIRQRPSVVIVSPTRPRIWTASSYHTTSLKSIVFKMLR